MSDNLTVILRKYRPCEDRSFLYATWRDCSAVEHGFKPIDRQNVDRLPAHSAESSLFYSQETRRIRSVLNHPRARVQMACLQDDPSFIVGYAVRIGSNLEFIYVKQDYRNRRVGTMLARGIETVSPPISAAGRSIAETKNLKIQEKPDDEARDPGKEEARAPQKAPGSGRSGSYHYRSTEAAANINADTEQDARVAPPWV